jgi:hypothetical protein
LVGEGLTEPLVRFFGGTVLIQAKGQLLRFVVEIKKTRLRLRMNGSRDAKDRSLAETFRRLSCCATTGRSRASKDADAIRLERINNAPARY